tara:strand:+ start:286 stop:483 length:198 start_codon:yes stop_codon:yes gene_type:complete
MGKIYIKRKCHYIKSGNSEFITYASQNNFFKVNYYFKWGSLGFSLDDINNQFESVTRYILGAISE